MTGIGAWVANTLLNQGLSDFLLMLSGKVIDWAEYAIQKAISYGAALVMFVAQEMLKVAKAAEALTTAVGQTKEAVVSTGTAVVVQQTAAQGLSQMGIDLLKSVVYMGANATAQYAIKRFAEFQLRGDLNRAVSRVVETLKEDAVFMEKMKANKKGHAFEVMNRWAEREEIQTTFTTIGTMASAVCAGLITQRQG